MDVVLPTHEGIELRQPCISRRANIKRSCLSVLGRIFPSDEESDLATRFGPLTNCPAAPLFPVYQTTGPARERHGIWGVEGS